MPKRTFRSALLALFLLLCITSAAFGATVLYPGMTNSPATVLSAGITADATTIPLLDASVLPAPPNLATIGTDTDAETILYTGKSGNNLTGVTRGYDVTGTYGTAKAWSAGVLVARNFTNKDFSTIKSEIEAAQSHTANSGIHTTQAAKDAFDTIAGAFSIHEINSNLHLSTAENQILSAADAHMDDLNLHAQVFNVKNYGALGNGSTDDTAAIQAAIAAAPTSGAIMYFPHGVYIAGPIYLTKSNLVFISDSPATELKLKNGSNADFITIAANDITFKNMVINGNNANNSTLGCCLVPFGDDIKITNCEIKDAVAFGIYGVDGERLYIENNYIHGCGNIGVLIGVAGYTYSNVYIKNNTLASNGCHGICVGNGATAIATNVVIEGNNSINNGSLAAGGGGIWAVAGADKVKIIGNNCLANHGDNIGIEGSTNVIVANNESSAATGPTADPVNSGVAISAGATGIVVSGNRCENNSAAGIIVRGSSSKVTITGNQCVNNSQQTAGDFHGIQIDTISPPDVGSGSKITITGNVCYDDQATKTQGYGLKIDSNAFDVIAQGNMLQGNKDGSVLNDGTADVIVDNNII